MTSLLAGRVMAAAAKAPSRLLSFRMLRKPSTSLESTPPAAATRSSRFLPCTSRGFVSYRPLTWGLTTSCSHGALRFMPAQGNGDHYLLSAENYSLCRSHAALQALAQHWSNMQARGHILSYLDFCTTSWSHAVPQAGPLQNTDG